MPERRPPEIETTEGRIRGRWQGGAAAFKGVRYGSDTTTRRFRPPESPVRWKGVVDALDYGHQSPQLSVGLAEAPILKGLAIERPSSEDCLFLNVWTAAPNTAERRPVMVWLHGGGFVAGSGASLLYDGTRLAARHEVVVVTVNHRLGIFGHLHFPDAAGEAFADAGHVGMLDLVLALRWVRDNIANFGGDPANVTIFGQSGGGCKVSTLLAMPVAKGLFHKAIVQSGSLIKAHTPETAQPLTELVMADLGLAPRQAGELARWPLDRIAPALSGIAAKVGWRFGPVIDGRTLTGHPCDPGAPDEARDVPLLVGATKDEATLTAGVADPAAFALDRAGLEQRLARLYPDRDATALIADLQRVHPTATDSDLYFTAASRKSVRRNAVIQAERWAARGGAPAFAYLLAWETPANGGRWKSPHGLDLALMFDNAVIAPQLVGPLVPAQRVADAISSAWARFAHGGSPGWAGYDRATRQVMVFDEASAVVSDPDGAERAILGGHPVNLLAPGR